MPCRRQCSSGLQAIADVAAAIAAGYYTIGIGAGVETMSQNPMTWEGGVNPRVAESRAAQSCMLPMGAAPSPYSPPPPPLRACARKITCEEKERGQPMQLGSRR